MKSALKILISSSNDRQKTKKFINVVDRRSTWCGL